MTDVLSPLLRLFLVDVVFLALLAGLLYPLARWKHAAYAVLKRNFFGYFSSPTGYVFILLFVGLCSVAAFFPYDFFNDNLASLHELNRWFALIMLVYVPTVTMGIWSEERRQGTDELLLTVPAGDWDIVLGKYLAASAIFTVALLFSQLSNFLVLGFLAQGDMDLGLFLSTYLGYWLVGLAMISIAMVGSFLTRNQTIGFILGLLLNIPLVVLEYADAVLSGNLAQRIADFSYARQFYDFGRGVVSLRAVVFFTTVIAIGLYLSVVLVGRRHWLGGRDGRSLLGHYLARAISLVVISAGLTFVFMTHDYVRTDATTQQVSALSKSTVELIRQLDTGRPILIEVFISRNLPEQYAKTKFDLVSKLNELRARSGGKILVRIYDDLEPYSDEAIRAREQYGIEPQMVIVQERGAMRQEEIFLGAAFSSGLQRVVVPFFDVGIPVEYELIRSIVTVAQPGRKRLGVVTTDARLFGGFDFQRMGQTPPQLIIDELKKQYEVIQIDANNPIEEPVDALLCVQPSSLTQPQLDNLVAAIGKGIPTALFEDPLPVMMSARREGE